jgi:outer membrane protein OmpA-like peptidoglycan-associated protein
MIRMLLFAGAVLGALIMPAAAQSPPSPPPPMPSAGPSWTGIYIGGDVGAGWSSEHFTTAEPATDSGGNANTLVTAPFDGSLNWPTGLPGSTGPNFTGGLHLGYNLDLGNQIVIGLETDAQYLGTHVHGNSSVTANNPAPAAVVSNQLNASTPWFGTLRARLGTTVLNPALLVYATGGFAYGHDQIRDTMTTTLAGTTTAVEAFPFSISTTRWGYTGGAGAEWMLNDRWSVKAEYLYVNLRSPGGQNVATTVPGPRGLATDVMRFNASSETLNIARVGISYHFPPPPAPPPEVPPAPPPPPQRISFTVFFDWDKDVITHDGMEIVQKAADAYKVGGMVQIQVVGYTDRSGSAGYNQRLSERRANNVAKALAGLGVPPNQMAVSGRGENDNRVPTADGVREPQNRRVEIGWP